MSYILEALEKSEQERKQRSVPDLQTQPTVYPGMTRSRSMRKANSSRRMRPAILLGIALVLSAWLLRDHLPVELEIRISRQVPQTINSPQDITTPSSPQTMPEPQIAQTGGSPTSTMQLVDNAQPETIPQQQTAQANSNETKTVTVTTPETMAQDELISPSSTTPGAQIEKSLTDRARVTLQPAPIILTDANDPASISVAEPVPFLEELPAAQQQELPTMKFAGHTYSSIPGDRLIIINNGIKRQGDSIGPGLKLEEITWDGVILNYRGLRFQVLTTGS